MLPGVTHCDSEPRPHAVLRLATAARNTARARGAVRDKVSDMVCWE